MPRDSIEIIKINLGFIKKCDCPETRAHAIDSIESHLSVLSSRVEKLQSERDDFAGRIKAVIDAANTHAGLRFDFSESGLSEPSDDDEL